MKKKEFIITVVFTAISLLVYSFFPATDNFQQIITTLLFLVLMPVLFSKYVLKSFEKYISFNLREYRNGFFYSAISLAISLLIFLVLSYFNGFINEYAVPVFITDNFSKFLLYEFFIVLPFVIIYEFFFRGFLVGYFSHYVGYWSILIQLLIFLALVLSSGDQKLTQYLPYIVFAPFAGFLAIKTKSLTFPAVAQFILIFILNVIVIQRLR